MDHPVMFTIPGLVATARRLFQLALLGAVVGVACWPFNLLDHWQDLLLRRLPAFSGAAWDLPSLILCGLPVLTMPLLLLWQASSCRAGAGSGIPETMLCLEDPSLAGRFQATAATLQRLLLWAVATISLMPMGREGPVVQMGAAVAHGLRQRFPSWLRDMSSADLLAVGSGAGLAAGFNTPLMATVFVAEELTGGFQMTLIWPLLVCCAVAAGVSNLAGQPMFALGLLSQSSPEIRQLTKAMVIGVVAGLLGALFGRLMLATRMWLKDRVRRQPLVTGLMLGLALMVLMLLSGGAAGGDGETLMSDMIARLDQEADLPQLLRLLFCRMVGPCLVLGVGVPGGLIDPAFTIGAVFGHAFGSLGSLQGLGMAIGMTAALAGATQLPVVSVLFALRLAGDQQLLPGMLLAAVIGAYMSRLLIGQPFYHVLTEQLRQSTPPPE
ncbi:MAG: chloride channel protein [Synechococcaceae cyanobacterium]|nr:chloride channel protein [Synechococcaceae cyanobacterium]